MTSPRSSQVKVAVTRAFGYLGRYIAYRLLEQGHDAPMAILKLSTLIRAPRERVFDLKAYLCRFLVRRSWIRLAWATVGTLGRDSGTRACVLESAQRVGSALKELDHEPLF
jgi:hypothetical protein